MEVSLIVRSKVCVSIVCFFCLGTGKLVASPGAKRK